MTIRKSVSSIQNKWHDAQRVDQLDLQVEQDNNNLSNSAAIQNHFGSGVLLKSPEQTVLFDSDNLSSTAAALLAAGNFDGTGISPDAQPSDINLGSQIEVELSNSVVFGRFSVKVLIIGVSFDDQLIYDRFYFYRNEKQVTSKHYKSIKTILFNDFLGNKNCSRNQGGRIVIKEAAPFELSRDCKMVAQDFQPNLFFRDFKVADPNTGLYNTLQNGIGPDFSADALEINITGSRRTLEINDITTQIGQKFLATTNNIQKITFLMGVNRDGYVAPQNMFDWSGDIVVNIYKLQTSVNCPTDIVPNLAIDFDPEQQPILQLSLNQSELKDTGYILTDVAQPVDFVFNNTSIAKPGGIDENSYYAIAVKRGGATTSGTIFLELGNDIISDSRLTVFSSGTWVDVTNQDLWFQVWTDAAKLADGMGYDNGTGILYDKIKVDTSTGASIDNEIRHLSFSDTGEGVSNIGILQATLEESIKVQDERTGNHVYSRQQFVPAFSFVTESGLNTLKVTSEPFVNGGMADFNSKGGQTVTGTQYFPGLAKGNVFCIVNPGPDLLTGKLIGQKLIPNTNSSNNYKIFGVQVCQDGYGDVNGDGYIDDSDVARASELIGESLSLASTQQKIIDGEIDTLELLRADVDGDGYVTSLDVATIQDFIDRIVVSFPAGSNFTHLCLQVQQNTGRYDGYFDCNGLVNIDGYLTDPATLPDYTLLFDGYLKTPTLESDTAFVTKPFVALNYEIVPQPFWQEYLVSVSSETRRVPSTFTYPDKVTRNSCGLSLTSTCTNKIDDVPPVDPGRNDFFVPDNLIMGNGQILRSDGSTFPVDVEVGVIVMQLPDIALNEAKINIIDKFVADRGDGKTNGNYPAMKFSDCSTVKKDALAKNQVRFDVSIQSYYPSIDGYDIIDGYGIIMDDIIGVHIDQSTGVMTLTVKDLSVDPIFLTLVTKVQILVWLKKAGWNNQILTITPGETFGIIAS